MSEAMKAIQEETPKVTELVPMHSAYQKMSIVRPRNIDELLKIAQIFSRSDLVPREYKGKPENVVLAIQMGSELGLAPLQALQNIAVINGRPCLWGDAMLALVQASGKLEYIREWTEEKSAHCVIKRKGYPEEYEKIFSDEDAQRAGLLQKPGPWQEYRDRQRQMRARSFALRDQFADVLRGLSSIEEVQDSPDPEMQNVSRQFKKMTGKTLIPSTKSENDLITEEERHRLDQLREAEGISIEAIKAYLKDTYNITHSRQIKKSDYSSICDWLLMQNHQVGNVK
ncbi:MAG: hypothetical protein A3I05_08775 [Deltaproteobacteria bacterium RIFCSPLOWO2_02_FULL_44_10]|nr:MAG: hypothetical protein A3C46_02305 [Deltaproteobacteria bacterium RIFCSPHIGHO2_02_FULL_44_16]OGQ45789.1 MAG: hypothetical protein A3I05_08775 [Deltaproteobacteria bacterium RIFCSPLOWO2_02_FULL_44_10]